MKLQLNVAGFLTTLLAVPMLWSAVASKNLDFSIHQDYISTRAMGMGNAFSAVVDDHSALFYNPAALARRKDGNIHMQLRGGISSNYLDFVDDISNASEDDGSGSTEADRINDVLNKYYGENLYSRVPTLGFYWMRPNWGIAVLPADLTTDLSIHRQGAPAINLNAYLDTTFAYGYGRDVNWFGVNKIGQLSAGITVKGIHRIFASDSVNALDLVNDSDIFKPSDAAEGFTVDADLGLLFTPKVSGDSWWSLAKPSFAFVLRNALDYGFSTNFHILDENSKEPPKLQRRIDLGSNWDLPNFWVFDPHLAVDIRDILHENWSVKKGLHVGAELYWTMYSWWKGHWSVGLNQGYPTTGFGARFAWFQIDLVTYADEVGTDSSPEENRRYMVELSLDF